MGEVVVDGGEFGKVSEPRHVGMLNALFGCNGYVMRDA